MLCFVLYFFPNNSYHLIYFFDCYWELSWSFHRKIYNNSRWVFWGEITISQSIILYIRLGLFSLMCITWHLLTQNLLDYITLIRNVKWMFNDRWKKVKILLSWMIVGCMNTENCESQMRTSAIWHVVYTRLFLHLQICAQMSLLEWTVIRSKYKLGQNNTLHISTGCVSLQIFVCV